MLCPYFLRAPSRKKKEEAKPSIRTCYCFVGIPPIVVYCIPVESPLPFLTSGRRRERDRRSGAAAQTPPSFHVDPAIPACFFLAEDSWRKG